MRRSKLNAVRVVAVSARATRVIAPVRAALCLVVVTGSGLALPTAAAAQIPAPDLGAMALRPADFPYGAKVTGSHRGGNGQMPTTQTLNVGDRASGRPVPGFAWQALWADDSAATARADVAQAKRTFASRRGRLALAGTIVKAAGRRSGITLKDVRFAPLRRVRAGDAAFELRYTLPAGTRRVYVAEALMSVDRVETVFVVEGRRRSRVLARRLSLLRTAARRIRAGLTPRNTALPVISGTPSRGETLTASAGSWDPATPPDSFGYQWERCDAAGGACAPIPGATGASYVLVPADSGATLRVRVTAANADGSAASESGQTGVVS